MAFSLEERFPFLDYRLVELASRLPLSYKLSNGETKVVLRRAMAPYLPEKIRTRASKIGFATPTDQWMRKLVASSYAQDLISSQRIPGVKREGLRKFLAVDTIRVPRPHEVQFRWRFLTYLMWRDIYQVSSDSLVDA